MVEELEVLEFAVVEGGKAEVVLVFVAVVEKVADMVVELEVLVVVRMVVELEVLGEEVVESWVVESGMVVCT